MDIFHVDGNSPIINERLWRSVGCPQYFILTSAIRIWCREGFDRVGFRDITRGGGGWESGLPRQEKVCTTQWTK